MRLSRLAPLAFLLVAVLHCAATARADGSCDATSVVVDTSRANSIGGTVIDSVGQTFFTADTLLTSLTVWGVEPYIGGPVRALIVAADASGVPTWDPPLWQSASPTGRSQDGLREITWTIDPPLVLPGSGTYAWFVCSTRTDLLAVCGEDAYAEGTTWGTCRGGCGPDPDVGCLLRYSCDYAFTVTFCSDRPTPARRRTWGELKSIYR